MLLVFWIVFFSACNITDRFYRGWAGGRGVGGRRGRVGSRRRVTATTQTQRAVVCLQFVAQTDTIHKGGQDWREEQPGTPCSPINALQGNEMHPGGLTASVKSRL